jgi:hypothetical protein
MATKDRLYSAGDVIGGVYRVIRVMEGGLGVVYAVEHSEPPRDCRRPFGLSHAAMAVNSIMA